MEKKEIGIVILATNAYFVLGLRFIRRFTSFYKGDMKIKFYFFSEESPNDYLPSSINVEHHVEHHKDWRSGTNSKFKNILKLKDCSSNYLYYFDADTNIQKLFNENWMIGSLVGGEHYSNRTSLKNGAGFDRNPTGNSYVPLNSRLPYTYHYGAFFGGTKENMLGMCLTLKQWQEADQAINYEPPVNDESYINKFFHYEDHIIVPIEKFEFVVSDKGGLGNTRQMDLNTRPMKALIKSVKNELWDIQNSKLILTNGRI